MVERAVGREWRHRDVEDAAQSRTTLRNVFHDPRPFECRNPDRQSDGIVQAMRDLDMARSRACYCFDCILMYNH
jgi:hypothetical protein